MSTIKPFMFYLTVQGVDHEDHMVAGDLPDPVIMTIIGATEKDFQQPQGIGAGVIIGAGEMVSEHLRPGYKIYYDIRYARMIGDLWVVDARAVIAYEEI